MRSGVGAFHGPKGHNRVRTMECVMDAQVRELKTWTKPELYQARAWFLKNQKLVGSMFAFNALNAIEQALEAK